MRERLVESEVGEIYLARLGRPDPVTGETRFALDAELNLPPERASLGVRARVAKGAAEQPIAPVVQDLKSQGIEVGKRQAQELIVTFSQDVLDFYKQRPPAAKDHPEDHSALIASHDSTGILVRPKALREATKKKAQTKAKEARRDDPMLPKAKRSHNHRMVAVGAVWEQTLQERSANDIVAPTPGQITNPTPDKSLPKPINKVVFASLKKTVKKSVATVLTELQRRDPDDRRLKAILLDGDNKQLQAAEQLAKKMGMTVTLVLDLLHVLHYVWQAAKGIYPKTQGNAEVWVHGVLRKLLTQTPTEVLAFLHGEYRAHRLSSTGRKKLKKCVDYLSKRKKYIEYAKYLKAGLPIASGVIEGTCRSLVKDRMAVTGARWGLEGGEAVLLVRAVLKSGDWEEYVSYHQKCEYERNHGEKRAA